jgi:hypothetical protein
MHILPATDEKIRSSRFVIQPPNARHALRRWQVVEFGGVDQRDFPFIAAHPTRSCATGHISVQPGATSKRSLSRLLM